MQSEKIRQCVICKKSFPQNSKAIYCSAECGEIAMRVINLSNNAAWNEWRKKKYRTLVKYVEKNNLREVLKKYLPRKRKSSK